MDNPGTVLSTLALTSAIKYSFSLVSWKQKKKKYELIGKVSEINTYPIKSCGGFGLYSADATRLGIRVNGLYDRHWLVVKPNGDFLTMRQYPQLALIETRVEKDDLVVMASGMTDLRIPLRPPSDRSKLRRCRVWENQLQGQDCGDEVSQWFSEYLKTEGIRLLFSAPELMKVQTESKQHPWGNIVASPGDQAGYQDECCGYLIMNQQSLDELNRKLVEPVTFDRFRPNLVIDGAPPFDEDTWQELAIGEQLNVRILEPCARCQLATINPEKGGKSEDGEPLKTLRRMRCKEKYGNFPLFGVLAAVDEEGPINIGDPVYVLRKPQQDITV
ncbi:hypothetical protein LOTGIDRAFT_110992 [Lottia gigantea]|uniref:MOSC domain-containing protein n=1 Tax=Lottia gigantea TaxID=225164 RepID=V4AGB0_LOTGI|nr:hypothetical protein LOTGIDRAFT_110992 [Lottia gigantea]ESP03079.1 hypothetical protein LOTGIDRAFT_110992 [Lottia gigantea]